MGEGSIGRRAPKWQGGLSAGLGRTSRRNSQKIKKQLIVVYIKKIYLSIFDKPCQGGFHDLCGGQEAGRGTPKAG